MFFYRLFVLLLFAIEISTALKCYSCGDENVFLGQEYSTPAPCVDFESSENLEAFIIECPEEYLGCITQSKGTELMRTCDTLAIDDCETANGITYCYCSTDLCNGKQQMQSHMDAHKSSRDTLLNNYPSDDEDYTDMSGHGHPDEMDSNENNDDDNHLNINRNYENNSSQIVSNKILLLVILFLSLNIIVFL